MNCHQQRPASRRAIVLAGAVLLAGGLGACGRTQSDEPVRLPAVFSQHMVLQQGQKLPVWGWAGPGQRVTVALDGVRRSDRAGRDGRWEVSLPAFAAAAEPLRLTVTGPNTNTITVDDVLIGEVWVCSGQSNMWWPVSRASDPDSHAARADDALLRMFTVPQLTSPEPLEDCEGAWRVCTPENVLAFSAVGYHFARELRAALGVPVGMLHTSWGGTPAEAWTSLQTLESDPLYAQIVGDRDNPELRAQNRGAHLYNAMLLPLVPYRIAGAIWYQGEANLPRAAQYADLFPALIRDWRRTWGQGDFPFYFVQLAPYRYGGQDPRNCAELREAQVGALALPRTGMAVTMDIGNPANIHPGNKHEVGRRLALWALAHDYGRQDLVYSGPLYASSRVEGDRIVISFDHVAEGLITLDGEAPSHFEIAGSDREFRPAEARIEGDAVVVQSDDVPNPVAVRYAWRDDAEPNLANSAGLPASPLRTDDWPLVTAYRE